MRSLFRQFSKVSLCTLLFLAAIALPSAALAAWKGSVTGSSVNVRSAPSLSAARLTQLQKGDAVTVLTTEGAWHQITAGSAQGWIHADYVTASTLRTGMRGNAVQQLQSQLVSLGWLSAGQADGIFGPKTEAAVRQYQAASGLESDGLAGTKTRTALQKESDLCAGIVAEAQKYLGVSYLLGGSNPQEGFDCSGLVQYVYRKFGIELPRVSSDQARQGRPVPPSKIRPGDLVAFYSPVSHVGIAIGNGKFIHAPKPGDSVKITELKYMPINTIRRLTGAVP